MLLQHEDGVLRVFPDWPSSMNASFTRLRAKGAFLVSSEQRDGKVTGIHILSEQGGSLDIQSPWTTQTVLVNSKTRKTDEKGRITIPTVPGGSYQVVPN
jgi:hypothetical protein